MKPFWISSLLLIAMVVTLNLHTNHLQSLLQPLQEELQTAQEQARAEDWEGAIQGTKRVREVLDRENLYLHITLSHAELDQLHLLLEENLAYLEHQKIGEYQASNQNLMHRLGLVYEMEWFSLQNLL